jgi:hypothetical protein
MTIDKVGAAVVQDRAMAREPRSDGPRRRTFSPAEKLALLAGYVGVSGQVHIIEVGGECEAGADHLFGLWRQV